MTKITVELGKARVTFTYSQLNISRIISAFRDSYKLFDPEFVEMCELSQILKCEIKAFFAYLSIEIWTIRLYFGIWETADFYTELSKKYPWLNPFLGDSIRLEYVNPWGFPVKEFKVDSQEL